MALVSGRRWSSGQKHFPTTFSHDSHVVSTTLLLCSRPDKLPVRLPMIPAFTNVKSMGLIADSQPGTSSAAGNESKTTRQWSDEVRNRESKFSA